MTVTVDDLEMFQFVGNPRLLHWAENFERIEPETIEWINSFPKKSTLYDLGASIGNFALYAAIKSSASVFALEPEIQNFSVLGVNHYLNREKIKSKFVPLNIALANVNTIDDLHIRQFGAGEHLKTLQAPITQDTKDPFDPDFTQPAMSIRLDDLVALMNLPQPTHMKIDVDGSEMKVLEGATNILSSKTLRSIMIELSAKQNELSTAAEVLANYGFEERKRSPVVRLRGGYYEDLFNVQFERPN